MPSHIYRRHLSPPVRKMCPIPNLPLIGENIMIFLLNLIFGKNLNHGKKLTIFAWSKPLQKCSAGETFGHLS